MNPALWDFGMRTQGTLLLHAYLHIKITDLEEKLFKGSMCVRGEPSVASDTENLYLGMRESQKKSRRKDEIIILKKWADAYARE